MRGADGDRTAVVGPEYQREAGGAVGHVCEGRARRRRSPGRGGAKQVLGDGDGGRGEGKGDSSEGGDVEGEGTGGGGRRWVVGLQSEGVRREPPMKPSMTWEECDFFVFNNTRNVTTLLYAL
ncbi:hypothetical protein BHE74_00034759 [Ensete ventricosum]|nr:hypothetical protein BHE74_00034759 [Ensete ventricosum]